jgi:hypothetical protein
MLSARESSSARCAPGPLGRRLGGGPSLCTVQTPVVLPLSHLPIAPIFAPPVQSPPPSPISFLLATWRDCPHYGRAGPPGAFRLRPHPNRQQIWHKNPKHTAALPPGPAATCASPVSPHLQAQGPASAACHGCRPPPRPGRRGGSSSLCGRRHGASTAAAGWLRCALPGARRSRRRVGLRADGQRESATWLVFAAAWLSARSWKA